jgi:hypothetical protein
VDVDRPGLSVPSLAQGIQDFLTGEDPASTLGQKLEDTVLRSRQGHDLAAQAYGAI